MADDAAGHFAAGLRIVIPGIVNTFIGLFKDTTLVAVVGIFDFLRTVETARLDPVWAGPTISTTGYIFAALFYFASSVSACRAIRFSSSADCLADKVIRA